MRNQSKFDTLSKNITNSKTSLHLDNSNNSSHILTSNHFYQLKDIKFPNYLNGKRNANTNLKNEIIFRNNNNSLSHKNHEKFIIHNKFINNDSIQQNFKKVNSEMELFQDYVLEDYKNQKVNDQRNIIEKLGACVEKKYNSINYLKNNNARNKKMQESLSLRGKGINQINEFDKNSISFFSKRPKHSFSMSHILDKKNSDIIPLTLNSPLNLDKKFISFSQKERNEKNVATLIKLKHYLTLYWKQRKDVMTEFFQRNKIYAADFYEEKNLYNFANYINDNVFDDEKGTKCNIETRVPLINIIIKGINYKPYFVLKKIDIDNNKTKVNNLTLTKKIGGENKDTEELNKEKDLVDFIESKDKIKKIRNFYEKNYKKDVINKLLKRFTKEEKLNYFSAKKYGEINITDKKNLVNNIQKQALYQKMYNSISDVDTPKKSINCFDNEDLKKLNDELRVANESILNKKLKDNEIKEKEKTNGIKNLRLISNSKMINRLNQRLYYVTKEKYNKSHPDLIPKKRQKLLEYIIVQRINERKNFEDKINKNIHDKE